MSAKITKKLTKKIDKLTNQWKININAEAVETEIMRQLKQIQSRARIDGFRQGKAPIEELDKRYGEDVMYRAVNEIIRNTVNDIIKEENYKLAVSPEVSFDSEIKRKQDIVVEVKITRKPEIPDIKYEKIEIEAAELELNEDDKTEEIERFRKQMARQKLDESGKAVETGDMVDIDFIGRRAEDGVEFGGGSANGYKLEIGSHSFINGFEEQIIGHKKGENFNIKVTFPKEYHVAELKGKDAVFNITINEIYIKELPELDEEFVKNLGFESVPKIKELLFSNVKNIFETNMKNLLKDKVFTSILEKNKIDLPESLIEKEAIDKLEDEKTKHKDDKKWNEKDALKEIKDRICKSYAGFYLIEGISEANAIEVDNEEIKQLATQDAIRNGLDVKEVLDRIDKDEKMKNYLYFTIKEAKVFDFVFDKIKKRVKKMNKKEFEKYLEDTRQKLQNNK